MTTALTPLPLARPVEARFCDGDDSPSPIRLALQVVGHLIATAALVLVGVLVVTSGVATAMLLVGAAPADDDQAARMAMSAVGTSGGVLLAMWVLSARKNRRLWPCGADFALGRPMLPMRQVLAWTAGAVAVVISANVVSQLVAPASLDELAVVVRDADGLRLVALAVLIVWLGPVAEELFFRGVVYRALRCRCRVAVALPVSAVPFAVLHLDLPSLPVLLVGGAAFALVLERTGSLVPAIAVHSTLNGAALLPYHAGVAAALMASMLIACGWVLWRPQRRSPQRRGVPDVPVRGPSRSCLMPEPDDHGDQRR